MKRKHYALLLGLLLVTSGWMVIGESVTQSNTINVYFFVAPELMPDGSSADQEMQALKQFLLDTAGGYTIIGKSEGGWVNGQGEAETENNYSFMVSSPQDISVPLRDFLAENFDTDFPYIITWQATSPEGQFTSSIPFWDVKK